MLCPFRPALEMLEDRCVPATITVTNLNDGIGVPGLTLREAVQQANGTAAADKIVFKTTLKGTLTLTDGVIAITNNLTIQGAAARPITIQGNGDQIFNVDNGDGDSVLAVALRHLSLTGAVTAGLGGAINNSESLTLSHCRVFDNQAGAGAAINSSGSLTLLHSSFFGNDTTNAGGGAIRSFAVGGLASVPLIVTRCEFFDNSSDSGGGALDVTGSSPLTISQSTFAGNRAVGNGGAILHGASGAFSLIASSVIGNRAQLNGGGLLAGGATAEVRNSTIAFNAANSGGGITLATDANFTLRNSTISSNQASGDGGGIQLITGSLTIHNSTITLDQANRGGGIFSSLGAALVSTIVARNVGAIGTDFSTSGTFSVTNCLVGDSTGINLTFSGLNVLDQNPLLGPLQNNGGPTLTHALQTGSPAINAGDNPDSLTRDQRGGKFKRVKGGAIDIGAFER